MRVFGLMMLLLISTSAMAVDQQKPLAIAAITAQQAQIRADVQAGNGRYANMPQATRVELLSRQAQLLAMLQGKVSANDLSEAQKTEAFNTLEWIEATINNTPEERMICRMQKSVGSNLPKRICRTPAQLEAERENARDRLDWHDTVPGGR